MSRRVLFVWEIFLNFVVSKMWLSVLLFGGHIYESVFASILIENVEVFLVKG